MHRTLVASALLSPLLFTAAAVGSQAQTDSSATTQNLPASRGITPARVVYAPRVELNTGFVRWNPMGNELLVKLNIDRDGTAQDIQVVNSSNPALDASVVDAVRKFRFRPAKLDDQAIPVDMNLTVKVDPVGLQP